VPWIIGTLALLVQCMPGDIAMSDYQSVLVDAQKLAQTDRIRLIEALWDTIPPDAEVPFSEDWQREIERRAQELEDGTAVTVPWETVRREAMARIRNGSQR
jgi:putative addiction module component (TIGR02574 family)